MRDFVWNYGEFKRGKAKVNWNVACKPKVERGLGIQSLESWNIALMSKHIWNIITHKESLWVKWIDVHKLKGRSFWDVTVKYGSCWAWKKLLRYKGIFRDHIVHRIGDGLNTSLWFDNWHVICPLSNFISKRDIIYCGLSLGCKVADVIKNGMWDWPADLVCKFEALSVITPPCLIEGKADKVVWRNNMGRHKEFSVSAVWNDTRSDSKLMYNGALGKDNLFRVLCKKVLDSHKQLFFECDFPKEVWSRLKGASVYIMWQERNLRTFQSRRRSLEVVCNFIKDVVRLRVMGLSLIPSAQVFDTAKMWNFHDIVVAIGNECSDGIIVVWIVAAGDVTGRVMIWKGFGDRTFAGDNGRLKKEDEKPGVRGDGDADSCTTRHWHFAEVKFLFFLSDGGYLYSGNPFYHSCMLLEKEESLKYGSLIPTRNNRIHFLKMPSMEILRSISGIKLSSPVLKAFRGSCMDFAFGHSASLAAVHT
ncbi:hypothetical protein Tco_1240110 [Tanacetum coccineum]